MIEFVLNAQTVGYTGNPERTLLQYLREDMNLVSMKDGCSSQGTCGCCTVEMNGKAVLSCMTKMHKLAGANVLTLEGLDKFRREVFAKSFAISGAVQCGFCTPGIVMRTKIFLDQNPNPTADEVKKALNPHICRCTGYKKIIDAVLLSAESIRQEKVPEPNFGSGGIGKPLPKYEAMQAALGERPFVCDMKKSGMLQAALKFSDYPRAKILAIDTKKAAQMPGVKRVFLAADFPGNRTIGLIAQDWPQMIAVGEITFYTGSVLAMVVADTEDQARAAAAEIKVEYEVLTPVTDMLEALKDGSPDVQEGGNLLSVSHIYTGDVEEALAKSAFVSRGVFNTQRIEHAFMEVEACLAQPWQNNQQKGIEVFSQTQGAYEDRKQIAKLLGLPLEQVNVIQVQNGGGFGGKEDLTVQGLASLAAFILEKPVKLQLSRPESMRMHPKRHPFRLEYALGCDKNGIFTALKTVIYGDTGAHASVGMKVLERACGHASGAYIVPVVDLKATAAYTNNVPCGAMRGFGVNQAAFAMESCIDDLCLQGGFDRWQIRWDNAIRDGVKTSVGEIIKEGAAVRACLEAVKEQFQSAKYAGIACGIKNSGVGNGMPDIGIAKIVVEAVDRIVLHHGWTEMGQGVHTLAVQVAVEELGLPPELFTVRVHTREGAECGMTTSSRGTVLLGNSLLIACRKMHEDLQAAGSLEKLIGKVYYGKWVCDWTTELGDLNPGKEIALHYSYGYAAQVVILNDQGKIAKVIAAHDAGRIMNPVMFEGQIEGAIQMGLGYALTEDFPVKDGYPVHDKFHKLGVLRAKQMPELEVIGIEKTDPHGPYGAKGVGEIGLVPTAAAVVNALCQFDGQRRYSLPTGEKSALPE